MRSVLVGHRRYSVAFDAFATAATASIVTPSTAIAESGRTPAEELLAAYDTRWGRSVDPVFEELRY